MDGSGSSNGSGTFTSEDISGSPTSESVTSTDEEVDPEVLSSAVVAGISIASTLIFLTLFLLVLALIVYCLVRRHRRRGGKSIVSIPGEYKYKGKKGKQHGGINNALYASKWWCF